MLFYKQFHSYFHQLIAFGTMVFIELRTMQLIIDLLKFLVSLVHYDNESQSERRYFLNEIVDQF